MQDAIEHVARAFWEAERFYPWEEAPDIEQELFRRLAKRAIEALERETSGVPTQEYA